MSLGQRRTERQQELWVATAKLPASIGHVFYDALNGVLRDGKFDRIAESLCEPFYKEGGSSVTCPILSADVSSRRLRVGRHGGLSLSCRYLDLISHSGTAHSGLIPAEDSQSVVIGTADGRSRLTIEEFRDLLAFLH